ncbi:hypothetical protein BP6252_03545 [Coleophoma cylindrospora]|uniref:AB hydrolase-1 domain-containing protein n=1 Tax=Coleophoma cylindrospora TaxID=1849047 RepID=A0A3D8S7Z4_9HELO|nr:hypothetical protein BP6252_03545 [Coleophoma cylindrospora]
MEALSRALHLKQNVTIDLVSAVFGVIFTAGAIKATQLVIRNKQERVLRSPRDLVLPKLTAAEQELLPYPPDSLPGGRDVDSPYGTMRVYEFGPEDGRKVLLVHGITTPCLALGAVAQGMADRGCRVMLFDLWGRGYSDSPDLPHDDRLFSTQILLALTSSPLAWTGDGRKFSIIAYSLGGCVATSFTAHSPNLVESLVLLCPTGLIRSRHLGRQRRVMLAADYVPEWIMEKFVKKTLQKPMYSNENKDDDKEAGVEKVARAELEEEPTTEYPISKKYPHLTVMGAVQWHLQQHPGFVRSFMSSVRYAPITGQDAIWKKLALREDKTLIVAGTTDPIIIANEIKEDAERVLGDKLEWILLSGAHDIPVVDSETICGHIAKFWAL